MNDVLLVRRGETSTSTSLQEEAKGQIRGVKIIQKDSKQGFVQELRIQQKMKGQIRGVKIIQKDEKQGCHKFTQTRKGEVGRAKLFQDDVHQGILQTHQKLKLKG
jgi:hypothetical protein